MAGVIATEETARSTLDAEAPSAGEDQALGFQTGGALRGWNACSRSISRIEGLLLGDLEGRRKRNARSNSTVCRKQRVIF